MKFSGLWRALCIGLAIAPIGGTAASAALKISSKPTQNVSCAAGMCTATAKKAVLNVGDLASMLATGNLKVASGNQAQDIEIDATLSWTSAHRLTLDVYQSITFNNPVIVAGTGALTITTNNGGTDGDFRFAGKGHVEFWDLSSSLVVNGQPYVLVKSLKQLDTDIRHVVDGHYALAKNINLSNRTYGASPINREFAGIFEGLGNTISNLSISAPPSNEPVGLFRELDLTVLPRSGM